MALPQDVVEDIIDCLADDRHGLATCALVSRHWIPRSRFHLFSTLGFTTHTALNVRYPHPMTRYPNSNTKASTDDSCGIWEGFASLLTSNPHISNYVRSLTLEADRSRGPLLTLWHGRNSFNLELFPNLRSLALVSVSFSSMANIADIMRSLPCLEDFRCEKANFIFSPPKQSSVSRRLRHQTPHYIDSPKSTRDGSRLIRIEDNLRRPLPRLRELRFSTAERTWLPTEEHRQAQAFAHELMDDGLPSNLVLLELSSVHTTLGWLPILPIFGPSLRHCALSLAEVLNLSGEPFEHMRENIFAVMSAVRSMASLRSLCVEYDGLSAMKRVAQDPSHASLSPLCLDALQDALCRPLNMCLSVSRPVAEADFPCPLLEHLSFRVTATSQSLSGWRLTCATLARSLLRPSGSHRARACPQLARVTVLVEEPKFVVQMLAGAPGLPLETRVTRVKEVFQPFEDLGVAVDVEIKESDRGPV